MRMDMGRATADAVAAALREYGEISRGGRLCDRPPAGFTQGVIARELLAGFVRTESRAYVTLETRYADAVANAGLARPTRMPPVLMTARASLMVWNHRDLPRGALEILPQWDPNALVATLARLTAFNEACGPEVKGTVRYGLLAILSAGPLESGPVEELATGVAGEAVRVLTVEPVSWGGCGLVLEIPTADAPTPCQEEGGVHA